MSRPQIQQPISIGIQGQPSAWPNLTIIQNKAQQQANQNHFFSDSYRPSMDKQNGMNTLENLLNKAPLNQAFTPMSYADNLGMISDEIKLYSIFGTFIA